MPVPVAVAVGVVGSVAFEYAWHRLKGERATTKEMVMAGAFGALPIAKVKHLRGPLRAAKYHFARKYDDARYLVTLGPKFIDEPIRMGLGRVQSRAFALLYIGQPIAQSGVGIAKRRIFSHAWDAASSLKGRKRPRTGTFTPRGD